MLSRTSASLFHSSTTKYPSTCSEWTIVCKHSRKSLSTMSVTTSASFRTHAERKYPSLAGGSGWCASTLSRLSLQLYTALASVHYLSRCFPRGVVIRITSQNQSICTFDWAVTFQQCINYRSRDAAGSVLLYSTVLTHDTIYNPTSF